jgi:undecaprenyl-diphosphatase
MRQILIPRLVVSILILLVSGYAIASNPRRTPSIINRPRPFPAHRPLRLHDALAARIGIGYVAGLTLFLELVLVVIVGSMLGFLITGRWGAGTDTFDTTVQQTVLMVREAWLTEVMRLITYAGDSTVVMCLALAIGLALWWRTHLSRLLWLLIASYVGARVIETTVKAVTQRPRPPKQEAIGEFTSFAFPSGHAIYATVLYGMVSILLIALVKNRRGLVRVCVLALSTLIVLVGLSRIYLGAHWLTDVIGGFFLGGLWLLFVVGATYAADRWSHSHSSIVPLKGG